MVKTCCCLSEVPFLEGINYELAWINERVSYVRQVAQYCWKMKSEVQQVLGRRINRSWRCTWKPDQVEPRMCQLHTLSADMGNY